MDDKYIFLQIIEQTHTSTAYEVMCKKTKRHLSIRRFVMPTDDSRGEWVEAFFSIMTQLARVQHHHVSCLIEADIDEDGAYLITDYTPTSKLYKKFASGMGIEMFKTFVSHGLCALSALHEKSLIHGRLSYSSFELQHNKDKSEDFILKDFGVRRIEPFTKKRKRTNEVPTNLVFASPEHFAHESLDAQTDLYMFGQLCYVLLAGFHPIAGLPVKQAEQMHSKHSYPRLDAYFPDFPTEIVDWIESLTQPKKSLRPASAEEALLKFYEIAPKPVSGILPKPVKLAVKPVRKVQS